MVRALELTARGRRGDSTDASRRRPGRWALLRSSLFCAVGVATSSANAADWKIFPSVYATEQYTDNVRLSPRGNESSDWITELAPSVTLRARGGRLTVDADYALRYRAYVNNSDSNGFSNSLRANGLLEVLDRKFFVLGQASVALQAITPLAATGATDRNITTSQSEVRQVVLSPYWVNRFGSWANSRVQADLKRAESDGAASTLTTDSRGLRLSMSSGPAFSVLQWSLAYSDEVIESTTGQFTERELKNVTGSLRYRVTPTVAGLSTFGREDNSYGNARGATSGSFYTLGVDWAPSSRSRITAQVGERYYGRTASLDAQHRTRLTSWQISYVEQVVAQPGLFQVPTTTNTAVAVDRLFVSQFPDPIERQQVVAAYIAQNGLPASLSSSVDFLTNQVTLSKRLQGTAGIRGVRSSFFLSVYRDNRESQTAGASNPNDPLTLGNSVVQTGFSGIATWRVAEATAASVSLGQQKSRVPSASREDKTHTVSVGVTHKLAQRISGSVEYRFLDRDSNAAIPDVRENVVFGTLRMAF